MMDAVSESPGQILVIRFGALGDLVLLSGALRALKEALPDRQIVLATKSGLASLVSTQPWVDEVVGLGDDWNAFVQSLSARRFEAVLDLHANTRSMRLRRAVSAPKKIVWNKRPWWQGLGVRLRMFPYRAHKMIAARYHDAVEQLLAKQVTPQALQLQFSSHDWEKVTQKFPALKSADSLVGLSPGANWFTKRWPVSQCAEAARALAEAGHQVVLTGAPDEAELCAEVAATHPDIIDTSGKLNLMQLTALLGHCRVFVANDTGPMHIARAVQTPTVALFGSTDPAQFDWDGHRMLYRNEPCAPCSLYGLKSCPKGHFRCLTDIAPDEVVLACKELLLVGRAAPARG